MFFLKHTEKLQGYIKLLEHENEILKKKLSEFDLEKIHSNEKQIKHLKKTIQDLAKRKIFVVDNFLEFHKATKADIENLKKENCK